MRKIRNQENKLLAKNTMKAVYTENESLSGYNRKRKAICFKTCAKRKRSKCHTPKLDTMYVSWNKEELLRELQTSPTNALINWSEIAREHKIPGRSGGQVAKEFARINGIDVFALDGQPENTYVQAKKQKMPRQETSISIFPTINKVKQEWDNHGEILLSEPCARYTLTGWTVNKGEVEENKVEVCGRRIL